MNNGWQIRKLDEVCTTIQDGAHESPKKQFDSPAQGRFLYITSKNIRTNYMDLTDVSYVEKDFHNKIYPRCQPRVGDVLLTKDGASTGNVTLNTIAQPFSLLSSVCLIKTDASTLNPAFLCYYLQSPDGLKSIVGQMSGAAIKRIILRDVKRATIPLPCIAEQQRIVAILKKAFEDIAAAKANTEKNVQNARALFDSHLQAVLLNKRWKQTTLGELCESVEYGSSAKSKKEGTVPVLAMGNIQNGRFDWRKLVYTDDKAEIKKYLLKHNDVLFNRTNSPELVGKTAIYKSEMPAIFAGYLIRIHRKEDLLDADYLNYYLNSELALSYGKTVAISSVNQANINGTKLRGYPIPIPPISEQRTIVQKLDGVREETQRLASVYERKLAALEALKKSLLHQAFTGQL